MIRIAFDVETDTVEETRAVLRLLDELGIEARPQQPDPLPRPHLVAVPDRKADAS